MSCRGLDLGVMPCSVTFRAGTLHMFRDWSPPGELGARRVWFRQCLANCHSPAPEKANPNFPEARWPLVVALSCRWVLRGLRKPFKHPGVQQTPAFPALRFPAPFCPQGLDEPEGWGSQLARPNFAGWEFFRVLIKRSHPERMTSLVHTHTLLPCPLFCPHSHAQPRQGWRAEGAQRQKQGL